MRMKRWREHPWGMDNGPVMRESGGRSRYDVRNDTARMAIDHGFGRFWFRQMLHGLIHAVSPLSVIRLTVSRPRKA